MSYTGIPEQKMARAVQATYAITVHIKFSWQVMAFFIKFIVIRQPEQYPHVGHDILIVAPAFGEYRFSCGVISI